MRTNELLPRFLSEKDGITATSANHLCNVAKEKAEEIQEKYKELGFIDIMARATGDTSSIQIKYGMNEDQLNQITDDLETISKLHSLIAWFREAIKIKDKELQICSSYRKSPGSKVTQRALLTKEELGESMELEYPGTIDEDSEEAKVKFLTIKELNEYYSLNSKSAVIGKYIHPNGSFQKFRSELRKSTTTPTELKEMSESLVVLTRTPSVSKDQVEQVFFELQRLHRATEARLNTLRQKVRSAVQDYNDKVTADRYEYTQKIKSREEELNQLAAQRAEELYRKVASIKIIIPDDLRSTYEIISNL